MEYKKIIMIICIITCVLFSVSGVFANEVINETIGESDSYSQNLQINNIENDTNQISDDITTSVVYFDASASNDGDGSKSNPYNIYKSDRINYGDTVYFADGVYDITDSGSIYSSELHKTTFIGQSMENTILKSSLKNKFDFTVTDNSYLVLNSLTMIGVHINNQANLIANDVKFIGGDSFNTAYPPSLSYSYTSKVYESTYGGVIICDTPYNKITTLNLTDCIFNNNAASSGGVIATYNSIANINNCVFYNSTVTRFGGAIYSIKSTLNVQGSSFKLNNAKYGGAIYANSTNLYLKDSEFSQSQSYSFGGVIASFSSKLNINHVVFTDYASLNDAGGAIYDVGGTLDIADSTFKDGYSDFGGAICNLKGTSTISNSQFINNTAQYYGGSIYDMYGSVVLNKNTFNNTYAGSGGSIFNRLSDSFRLTGNTFINSRANDGEIIYIDGDHVDVVQQSNVYDTSYAFLKYGNIYEIDYYAAVPIINYSPESKDGMPTYYDGRKYGYVTPAKDQIQGGNCWAFSGIATLEACIKKATGVEYDFSEENVKNLMSEYSLFDSDTGANSGGNLYMFIAYLASWFGPTYDENDIYDDFSALSVLYDSLIHVQNVYILPERQSFYDNDYIKNAVLDYGAVSIGIDLSQNQGHAVTIVGWDDEFVSNDFLGNKAVGAWIIKNSWGTSWGYDGFGYLSYQQPISFGYTFIFDDDRGYSDIYQYDFAGKRGTYSVNTNEIYLKNKFTAKNNEILSAFSTYFDEPTNFTASVYLNGKLVTTQSGISQIGYYTIPFEQEISLNKGDTFEIVVKIYNGAPVYIPISPANEITKMSFGKGISFYSTDGVNWNDLYESTTPGVACIKAFTRTKDLTQISIDASEITDQTNPYSSVNIGDLINIPLNLPQYFTVDGVQYPVDGLVTFKINDQYYYATVENGKACLNISFEKEGTYNVTAQFKSNRVVSNEVNFQITVVKTAQSDLVIKANDVSKFYGGSEKYVATLYNGDELLSGVNVKITVNGQDYTVRTNSNGQAILDLSLPAGTYDVRLQYGGKIATSKFTVLTTIGVENVTKDFLNSYVSASFLNTDGSFLSNKDVTFIVEYYGVYSKPVEVAATTNVVGVATAKINYYVGKYLVSVSNPVSGEKKQFTLDISPIDSNCILSVTQSGTDIIIKDYIVPVFGQEDNSDRSLGYVNFLVSGKVYKVNVKYSIEDSNSVIVATLRLQNLDVGDYSVTAIYSGTDDLRPSSDTREFSVTANPHRLMSSNYYSYYDSVGTMVKLGDIDGNEFNPIKGEVVSATILNKTYFSTTDENGIAYFLDLDLEVGNYSVIFENNGQSLMKYIFVYSTIDNVTTTAEYLNSKFGASFIEPINNDPFPYVNSKVKFIINETEYTATTDDNGYGSLNVDLPVGISAITSVNTLTNEKKLSTVTIYKTTPKITISRTRHGNSLFITATLSQHSAVGNVIFTMGSNKYTTEIIDGKAMLALNYIEEGNYSVYANYIGDSNFYNIKSETMNFTFYYVNYTLSAPTFSKYYGGSEKFIVTLTNFNNPAPNEIINLTIGNKVYAVKTNSNGVASFESELDPGRYDVRCTFDEEIVSSEITIKSTINVKDTIADVSYTKVIAEIMDGNGNLVKNKVIKFKVSSKEYEQTTDNSGIATLEADLDKGNYVVAITNPVTGEIKNSNLVMTKSTPTFTVTQAKQNGIDIIKAVLPKAATGEVNFAFDNGDVYTFEVEDGVSILDGLDVGKYSVVASYSGDENYNPVSKSVSIVISSLSSTLTASKVTTTYGTSKNIVVKLIDSKGDILYGSKITVTLNNKKYSAVVTGEGNAVVAVPASLAAKTYTATITYAGDTNILASSTKISVVVNKATPKLTAAKKTFKVKAKTKNYVVTLKTDKNKVFKNQKVTIKVNGKTYTAKTNSKGKATLKLTKLTKKGTFTATVKYAATANYKAVSKKVKITVK